MSGFEPYYKKILAAVKECEPSEVLVIRTAYSAIAKTIGLREFAESEDYHLVLAILDAVEERGITLGVYLRERLCSTHLGIREVGMNGRAEKMMRDGARVVEI